MRLTTFILQLNAIVEACIARGIDLDDIEVCIHNDLSEGVGKVDDVNLHLDISEDEIPYDAHGLDRIAVHDNVVIISGD